MTITNARAIYALFANATPTRVNVGTQQTIGENATQTPYTGVEAAYSVGFAIVAGSSAVLDLADNDTAGSDAWTAGVAQVETQTLTPTGVIGPGTAYLIVTAAGMTGSPKTFAQVSGGSTTAAALAQLFREQLAADAAVSSMFTVSGTIHDVVLTRKPLATVNGVNVYAGNDATLNIEADNGTMTGMDDDASSVNTTAGVATTGVTVTSGATEDFEGNAITPMTKINGVLIQVVEGTDVTISSAGGRIAADPLKAGCNILCDFGDTGLNTDVITIDANTDPAYVIVTVLGYTA